MKTNWKSIGIAAVSVALLYYPYSKVHFCGEGATISFCIGVHQVNVVMSVAAWPLIAFLM